MDSLPQRTGRLFNPWPMNQIITRAALSFQISAQPQLSALTRTKNCAELAFRANHAKYQLL
jgi:hypothetical protein